MSFEAAEADRRIATIVEIATVTAVSGDRIKMRFGDVETNWIPVGHVAVGETKIKTMPSVGEQRLIFCPGGDVARAVSGPAIAASNLPGDDNEHTVINLGGELRIEGNLVVTGKITVSEDVIADGVSLVTHKHTGVTPGSSKTGEPE